jgi:hypothetical protein
MAPRTPWIARFAAAIAPATIACSGGGGVANAGFDASSDASVVSDGAPTADSADASTVSADVVAVAAEAADDGEGADGPAAPAPFAYLRLALLSTDVPALDFCLGTPGTGALRGPLIGQFVSAAAVSSDAGVVGLGYAEVSTYFTVDAGATALYLVPAGSASCSSAFASDAGGDAGAAGGPLGLGVIELPPFVAVAYTILVAGEASPADGGPGVSVRLIPDGDPTVTSPERGGASLRAINAVSGAGPQDFGFGSFAGGWLPLFTGVAFAAVGTQAAPSEGVLDPNGYLPIEPFSDEALSARASVGATSDTAVALDASVAFGSIATIFGIGTVGDVTFPPRLLLCDDNAPVGGYLADCSVIR